MYLLSNWSDPTVVEMHGGSMVGEVDGAKEIDGAEVLVTLAV